MTILKLEAPPRRQPDPTDRINLAAILLVLDEILYNDGADPEVIVDEILPRIADEVRDALRHHACLKTVLEERLAVRDARIVKLEDELAKVATGLDGERTHAEMFLRALREHQIHQPEDVIINMIDEELTRF